MGDQCTAHAAKSCSSIFSSYMSPMLFIHITRSRDLFIATVIFLACKMPESRGFVDIVVHQFCITLGSRDVDVARKSAIECLLTVNYM